MVEIAGGYGHTLVLGSTGVVLAWGKYFNGTIYVPVSIPPDLTNVIAIAAGLDHDVALRADGRVIAWGYNQHGQTDVPDSATNVVTISAGQDFSMALRADGNVIAWGYYLTGVTNIPTGLTNVVAVSAGGQHCLALVNHEQPLGPLAVSAPDCTNSTFSLSVPTQSGRVYALEFKKSLSENAWSPLPLVTGTGNAQVLTDPFATNSQRFYRLRRW